MNKLLRRSGLIFLALLLLPVFLGAACFAALIGRRRTISRRIPHLFWGSVPIINNKYWAQAMREAGFVSETFTTDFYAAINSRSDWDMLMSEEFARWPVRLQPFLAFLRVMLRYDVLFISFEGVFIGNTDAWRLQAPLLRLAGKKIVVIPYGGDAYVYRYTREATLTHGLLMSYPGASRRQSRVAAQVEYWCRYADVMIPGFIGPDGVGRWDVLMGSQLFIDLSQWRASSSVRCADGRDGIVTVCHTPNHRGFKGTEFVVAAVEQLRREGLLVELRLIENLQNEEVHRILREDADVLVEQLVFTGHGMSALEGMASGIPVVSNLENYSLLLPFRRWSFFSECPIVSASPETIVDVLRKLVTRPELRQQLSEASRSYVEKYHSTEAAKFLFTNVLDYLAGQPVDLINLYHPLKGAFVAERVKVEHPLVNNRIVS